VGSLGIVPGYGHAAKSINHEEHEEHEGLMGDNLALAAVIPAQAGIQQALPEQHL